MNRRPKKPLGAPAAGIAPPAVVNRLSLYLRELLNLAAGGSTTVSSSQLGVRLGFTDAQVRKDLAHFGQFGCPGVGYRCDELIRRIRSILGTDRSWPVLLVGIGNLGRALLRYRGFEKQGFRIVAACDCDPEKIGRTVEGFQIQSLDEVPAVVAARGIRLAILSVPAGEAQSVANHLVAAGIAGVLNFAPVTLNLPNHVRAIGVDLAIELEQLSFAVVNSRTKP